MFINYKLSAKQLHTFSLILQESRLRHRLFTSCLHTIGGQSPHQWSTAAGNGGKCWPIYDRQVMSGMVLMCFRRHLCDKKVAKSDQKFVDRKRGKELRQQRDDLQVIKSYRKLPMTPAWLLMILKKPNELIEWYDKTPPDRRRVYYLSWMLLYLVYPVMFVMLCWVSYALVNFEENPLTGRETVKNLPKEMMIEIENDILKEIFVTNMTKGTFIPATHPLVQRIDKVVERIIDANDDLDVISDGLWTPIVIDNDKLMDIIVLKESQNIFISKTMLNMCETDDELAYVLCHQLAHIMLDHTREPTTYTSWLYKPLMVILPKLWSINSDQILRVEFMEGYNVWFDNQMKKLMRKGIYFKAYNDLLEEEADRIAMQLLTRSCFDVRKCRQFCVKYKHLSEEYSDDRKVTKSHNRSDDKTVDMSDNFFAKHPINDNKLLYLFQYTKPFLDLRLECKCEPLVVE